MRANEIEMSIGYSSKEKWNIFYPMYRYAYQEIIRKIKLEMEFIRRSDNLPC